MSALFAASTGIVAQASDDIAPLTQQCIGCHGVDGYKTAFPLVYTVPKIDGQRAEYIAAALTAYKNGERQHPSMVAIAKQLSDEDITRLAKFYSEQ